MSLSRNTSEYESELLSTLLTCQDLSENLTKQYNTYRQKKKIGHDVFGFANYYFYFQKIRKYITYYREILIIALNCLDLSLDISQG